jgi:hypothetical protein
MNKEMVLQAMQEADQYERFNQLFACYKKTVGKSQQFEMRMNRVGFTQENLESLVYELKKLHGVSDVELAETALASKNTPTEVDVVIFNRHPVTFDIGVELFKAIGSKVKLKDFDHLEQSLKKLTKNQAQKALEFIQQLKEQNAVNTVKEDIFEIEVNEEEEVTADVDEPQKLSLREEFPFLNDKDCPDEFHTAVGRMISAHKRYQEAHTKLSDVSAGIVSATEEEVLELTKTAEAEFNENRALWAELNHYNIHKEVLGKHILFKEKAIAQEVEEMTQDQLLKFINSSAKFFTDNNKKIAEADGDPERVEKLEGKIKEREFKLKLVKQKLGV